jgi:hypothetical protein
MIDPLLLTAARIGTFDGERALTNASGFFFERDERLYLVTSRHVFVDAAHDHHPSRIVLEIHSDPGDLARSVDLSVPLFRDGLGLWRQGQDAGGEIDVATIEIDRAALPPSTLLYAFTPDHLQHAVREVPAGQPVLILGFPLGFHDTLHHLPVVRQAVIASSFGLRFQGQGFFLTDARTHRGTSGAPVVMRASAPPVLGSALPWKLLGVHSARMDMRTRDLELDESLGLNCAWYADILMTLTGPQGALAAEPSPQAAGSAAAPPQMPQRPAPQMPPPPAAPPGVAADT